MVIAKKQGVVRVVPLEPEMIHDGDVGPGAEFSLLDGRGVVNAVQVYRGDATIVDDGGALGRGCVAGNRLTL